MSRSRDWTRAACAAVTASMFACAVAAPVSAAEGDQRAFLPPYGTQGCWVSIFDEKNFMGQSARMAGPTFIEKFDTEGRIVEPDLRNVGGQDFFRRIDSLIVGPNAKLIAYAGQWFSAAEITFLPNARVADLDVLNFSDRIESVKLRCVQ
jgi:hypothetical protein